MLLNEIRNGYLCYLLRPESRAALLEKFSPKFPDVLAHHITVQMGVQEDTPLPEPAQIIVYGYALNPEGVEALIVMVNGTTSRPDGRIYHCTWSIDRSKGFKPVDSNTLIRDGGWEVVPEALPVETVPAFQSSL